MSWGVIDIDAIARHVGRSSVAVAMHARAMQLSLPNSMSLATFARTSGWARSTIELAAERLGIKFRHAVRIDPRQQWHPKRFMAQPDERAAILQFLESQGGRVYGASKRKTVRGVWGVGIKPSCCHECGFADEPHFARGFCKRCYTWIIKSRAKEKSPWESMTTSPRSPSPSKTEFSEERHPLG